MIAADYAGVDVDMSKDFKMGETNQSKEYLARHPLGTVPAMEHGDVALTDSSAMAQYSKSLSPRSVMLFCYPYQHDRFTKCVHC